MDSTLISSPSSTKNREKNRDPEAHSTNKRKNYYFGYKAHVGVDRDTGLVHTLKVTAANVHDVTMTAELLTGEEETVHGDSGYLCAENGKRLSYKIKEAKKFITKSIPVPLSQKTYPPLPRLKSCAVNGKNPPSEQKSSMFSL